MSINREDVVHTCNGISAIKMDKTESFAETWMDLETVIQSEISQKKKNTNMWNLEKWHRWSFLQSRNRNTDIENKCMDTKGETERRKLGNWAWGVYTIAMKYKLMKTYCIVLGSFNGPEPGGLESTIRKLKKERKRLIFPELHRKPIKPLDRACTTHIGTGHPLKKSWEVLEARAGKWAWQASALHGLSQKER